MADELRHADVVAGVTSENDFESTTLHICNNQAAGDVIYAHDGTVLKRLAKGTNGDFLASGTPPSWVTHADLDTGVHGAGGDVLATDADITADIATHTAILGAHQYGLFQVLRTGEYFHPGVGYVSTTTLTANRMYSILFPVPRDLTVDRMAIEVTAEIAAAGCFLGIHSLGTNLAPGALLVDGGEVDCSTIGIKAAVLSEALTGGIYFVTIASEAAITVRSISIYALTLPGWFRSTNFSLIDIGWYKTHAYGALPDPFGTPTGPWYSGGQPPLTPLRLLSLD